jgi:hypothetical protein
MSLVDAWSRYLVVSNLVYGVTTAPNNEPPPESPWQESFPPFWTPFATQKRICQK